MKKILSSLMILAILLTFCACGTEKTVSQETTAPTEPLTVLTEDSGPHELTEEDMYGHINQMELTDGVYKIWNADGVTFMMGKTEGDFRLLCNIDMQGAVLAPMPEFTGTINGGNFTISNFTIQGGDEESFGFVSVNKGSISNLNLSDMILQPGSKAEHIGSVAGINEGTISRVNPAGILTVDTTNANCGGIAGKSNGEVSNVSATVDVICNAQKSAKVGGIFGVIQGGTAEFISNHGGLTVNGETQSVGLFAGEATEALLKSCVFGGPVNTLNGHLILNFTGNPDDDELTVAEKALWRDNSKAPLTEGQAKLRDRVVEEMLGICSVQWKLDKPLPHTCYCTLSVCYGTYNTSYTYIGIPYNHKGGSLSRFKYCFDEAGYAKDWVYELPSFDGFDAYIGADCSTSVQQAYWTVSNSVDFMRCNYQLPQYYAIGGCLPVGNYNCDFELRANNWTDIFFEKNTEQEMMEAYASAYRGDLIVCMVEAGGHTRMIDTDPVVIRDQAGNIDPNYSYVTCSENVGMEIIDEKAKTITTCRYNFKWTFASLLSNHYIPVTCEELLTGEMETPECTLTEDAPGRLGLTTGYIKANYFLDSVTLTITDSKGNTVFDHKMFTTAARRGETGDNDQIMRCYKDDYDMAYFATPLQNMTYVSGETYRYTITASLATYDEFLLKEDTFTIN